ncbi:hypothetical protein TNCV_877991 [Trichonephila clavipes]|nr:hypothetical protein TNCV_877991 [Trichonephila clavipes]
MPDLTKGITWSQLSIEPPRIIEICGDERYVTGSLHEISETFHNLSVTRHVRCVTTEILNSMVDHAVIRFQHVVASGGSHIEHIM